jgi:hypothetical protein
LLDPQDFSLQFHTNSLFKGNEEAPHLVSQPEEKKRTKKGRRTEVMSATKTVPTTTSVVESAVIRAPLAQVWHLIKLQDFSKFWSLMKTSESVKDAQHEAEVFKWTFSDGTVYEIKQEEHSVSFGRHCFCGFGRGGDHFLNEPTSDLPFFFFFFLACWFADFTGIYWCRTPFSRSSTTSRTALLMPSPPSATLV